MKCQYCGEVLNKSPGEINRANKSGLNLYCNRTCAGLNRRVEKDIEQKKKEKAEYDKQYWYNNKEVKRKKAKEYHLKNRDRILAKQRAYNKTRYAEHLKYLQRPEYKEYKKEYDRKYLAKKSYGEFYEVALIVNQIDMITDSRESFREKKKYLKSTSTKKRQNGKRNIKCNQP